MSNYCGITIIDKKEDKCTYTWTINNFSYLLELKGKLEFIESSCFLSNNRQKWNLGLSVLDNDILIDHYHTKIDEDKIVNYQYSLSILDKNNKKCDVTQRTKNGEVPFRTGRKNKNGLFSSGCWRIKEEVMYDRASDLLPNDTLQILFELSIFTYKINEGKIETPSCNDNNYELCKCTSKAIKYDYLAKLFLDEKFTEIKLVTSNGKEFKANKNIFKEMLRYIYTDKVENIETIAKELFIAADTYNIEELKRECEKHIAANVTAQNAIEILEFAEKFGAHELKGRAIGFIKLNISEIIKMDSFKSRGALAEIIQSILD